MLSKLNLDKNVIFVDVSYLTFYRFFALKKWFSFANKEVDTSSPDFKWLENEIFLEKFKNTFLDTILKIAKSKNCKVPLSNIVFAYDCHHKDIWRLKFCNKSNVECPEYNHEYSYKGDRKAALKKQRFEEYEVFDLAKNEIIPRFIETHNNIILEHKNAEADDCIAVGIKHLINNKKFKKQIWIIASDFDYLQLCNDQIHLMDLKRKSLDDKHLKEQNINNVDYLIRKIMIGDKSDNIFPCRFDVNKIQELNSNFNLKLRKNKEGNYVVTLKVFEKIRSNEDLWNPIKQYFEENKKQLSKNKYQKKGTIILEQTIFDINQRLIDFDLIPNSIKFK